MSEIETLMEEIEATADKVPDAGADFAESVLSKAGAIMATVEERGSATNGQIVATENMLSGLQRWIK